MTEPKGIRNWSEGWLPKLREDQRNAEAEVCVLVSQVLPKGEDSFDLVDGGQRTASVAATLKEKLRWQKRQRELEDNRNQLRRRIFDRQDEIDTQRCQLIDELEGRLSRRTTVSDVFVIQWELN